MQIPIWKRRVRNDPEVLLRAGLGTALKHLWLPYAHRITLSGSNVSTMNDVVGGATMTASSGTPIWNSTGGPGGAPYIDISTTSTLLTADGVSLAAANRIGIYVVGSCPGTSADRIIFVTRQTDGTGGSACGLVGQSSTGHFRGFFAFTGGTQDVSSTVSSDSSFHLFALRPLAAGASARRDGVEQSPTFTGTDTVKAIESAHIGQNVASAGGKFVGALLVDLTTNPTEMDQIVRNWAAQTFGIAA